MADGTGATTANASAAAQPAGGEPQAPKIDFNAVKFDGTDVPEKFKGKTMSEISKLYAETESAKTKADQNLKQWNEWYQKEYLAQQVANAAQNRGYTESGASRPSDDPREAFEEHQISALGKLFEVAMSPVMEALSSIQKESVKGSRSDFTSFEERASEIYGQMPYAHKINPQYGWNFAYNMARAEKMGKEPPPPPNQIAASIAGAPTAEAKDEPLSPAEELWAKRFKMSPAEYRKFSSPREEPEEK